MQRRHLVVAATAALLATFAWGADGDGIRWLNMHVTDRSDETEVQLHVPFALVVTVLDSIDGSSLRQGRVQLDLDGVDVDWVAVLNELKKSPDGDYLAVRQPDADVRVTKRDGAVLVQVDERQGRREHVDIRIPARLLEAFRIDEHNRLDLKALLVGLDTITAGELLRVESPDTNVRIWVE